MLFVFKNSSLNRLLLAGLLISLVFTFYYCKSHKRDSSEDSLSAEDRAKFKNAKKFVYICRQNVKVNEKKNLTGKTVAALSYGDSVVEWDDSDILYSDSIYNVWFEKDNKILDGYVRGKSIGIGITTDLYNDGKKEIVALHYTNYNQKDDEHEFDEGKAEMVLIKDLKLVNHFSFKAYSNMFVSDQEAKGYINGMRFFKINYGIEGCDYPETEILTYFYNNKLDSVSANSDGFSAGNYSEYTQYIFPKDSGGVPGKLLEVYNQVLFHNESDMNIETGRIIDFFTYSWQANRFVLENHSRKETGSME